MNGLLGINKEGTFVSVPARLQIQKTLKNN
jgi:hypothetical protein